MYRVIVADRNSEDTITIGRLIDRFNKRIKVIKKISNGMELVRLTQELDPHLIILDIKLASMNGIEAIRKIRVFNSKVSIIILTEYDYFEFTQTLIPLNIEAYLTKPIKNEEVFNALHMILDKLKEEDLRNELSYQREQEKQEYLRYTGYSFIYTLLFSGEYKIHLEKFRQLLRLEAQGYIINLELNPQYKEKQNMEKESYILYQTLKSTIEKETTCVVGPAIMNNIVIYICEKQGEGKGKLNILRLCNKIKYNMKEHLNIQVYIGTGSLVYIEELHLSYEESIKSLRYQRENNLERVYLANVDESITIVHQSYIELERLMIDSVRTGQLDSLSYFASLLDILKSLNLQDRKNKIIELIILACHAAREEGPDSSTYLNYIGYIEEIDDVDDIEVEAWAYRKFRNLINMIQMRKTSKTHPIIHNAVTYIEKHYTQGITLEEVAGIVGLTPQYFSSFFKDEMEVTFTEYVTKLRIEKAKEVIRNSQMSIQEICYYVGYHDPNYFSRIFKKYVGCTPTRYKKEYRNL